MTIEMWLAVGILVLMIVMIMSDKFAFGSPPMFASFLLVLTGLSSVQDAFSGFISNSVIMVAGFMIVLAGLMKTSLITKVQDQMINLINKGGYRSYASLLALVMLGTTLVGSGNTGYYVLILAIIAAIPYNKNLPTSKLMMPLGFATNHPLVPINVALFYGVAISVLEAAGITEGITMWRFAIVNLIVSIAYLAWALVSYKILPDHEILEEETNELDEVPEEKVVLPQWKETVVLVAFIISVIGMMLLDTIGDIAYVIPGIAGFIIHFIDVVDFKEVRDSFWAPVIIMMAGVVGVADALTTTGFTEFIGDWIASAVGTDINPFILILIFTLLTSSVSAFTGSNMGSVFIFAPIAIASSIALGISPIPAAVAVTISGWNGGYMPIDGMPAMIFGMGKYKLSDFWKFTIPMYLIRVLAIAIGSILMFPA